MRCELYKSYGKVLYQRGETTRLEKKNYINKVSTKNCALSYTCKRKLNLDILTINLTKVIEV